MVSKVCIDVAGLFVRNIKDFSQAGCSFLAVQTILLSVPVAQLYP